MDDWDVFPMIRLAYRRAFDATLQPAFVQYLRYGEGPAHRAALGFARAGDDPLFLERYCDAPIEALATAVLGRSVPRGSIVEIGNFAATDAAGIVELWSMTANDLGNFSEVAAATLTRPLRRMFARIGVPIHVLLPADPTRLGEDARAWGSYYELDPQVCIGEIAAGQRAMSALRGRRRNRREAA